jgi:hypothetical protein
MLQIVCSKDDLNEWVGSFIWTYKIGDNISYNLDILFQLINDHNNAAADRNYGKPISILGVSIIEAVLVDLLERLDRATNHFPAHLNAQRHDIKAELQGQQKEFITTYQGKSYKGKRLKNFGYVELIAFCEKFHLLGADANLYTQLQDLGRFRNRVHIRNYFGNFERNESRTFSEKRTQNTLEYMQVVVAYLHEHYERPG